MISPRTNCTADFVHPELGDGELFFTNSDLLEFEQMTWRTKRKGNIAYDGNGNPLSNENWFPVFLQQMEIALVGKNLTQIRKIFRAKHTA
jgi:hypothetical protein